MRLTPVFLAAAIAFAQKPPDNKKQRDLDVVDTTKETPRPAPRTATAKPVTIPRSYALLIGVGDYANLTAKQQLKFAERDAEMLYSVLISPEGGNFRAENVKRLIGKQATLANMRQAIEQWLPSVAKDDDRVLIYFAGHGFVAGGQAYLAPHDIRTNDIQATGYPMARLGETFAGKIKGKWKVLLTDSCHSGAITPEAGQTINRSLIDLNKSVFVMTASRDRELSYESVDFAGGRGVFTYFVERGMTGAADENRDGIVTADELSEYVRANVRKATEGKQNPTEGGSFDKEMLLAYSRSGVEPDAPQPAKFGNMIIESNMDGVEVFVDGKSVGVLEKGKPFRIDGIAPGPHQVQGVKMGYDPDGPREEIVYPGQDLTVSIRIRTVRRRPKAAVDELNRGLEFYQKGGQDNYKKAVPYFAKALETDSNYSEAALYLGRAYNAMFDQAKAEQYFRKSVDIDPDYVEARASFGGMLLDKGDNQEAIRQLTAVVQRDKKHSLAYTQLAAAFRMTDTWDQSIDAAHRAIELAPNTAEPHFWLAESLRMKGDYAKSKASYQDYLRLSDFDSKLAGQLNYWVRGFLIGGGRKRRAAQADIWRDLRSLAYFGLCDADRKLKRYDDALPNCQKALSYDRQDPYLLYALGLTYARKAEASGNLETLAAASRFFQNMLQVSPEIEYAGDVKKMLASFDQYLRGK